MRSQVGRLGESLRLPEDAHVIEGRDWSHLGQLAEKLLQFLDLRNGPVPPAVVQALTVAEVRARLAEAVRLGEAAQACGLVESWGLLTQLFDTG
jgi:hypothetical protein